MYTLAAPHTAETSSEVSVKLLAILNPCWAQKQRVSLPDEYQIPSFMSGTIELMIPGESSCALSRFQEPHCMHCLVISGQMEGLFMPFSLHNSEGLIGP